MELLAGQWLKTIADAVCRLCTSSWFLFFSPHLQSLFQTLLGNIREIHFDDFRTIRPHHVQDSDLERRR